MYMSEVDFAWREFEVTLNAMGVWNGLHQAIKARMLAEMR
jgi:hypothetical protein